MLIIWCKFFFLFIDRKPTTWPANNCLQIMVCSWMYNVILMRKRNHAFLLLAITLLWKMADRIASQRYSLKNKLGHWMIKHIELGYRKILWFVSVSLTDQYYYYWSAHHWQITMCCSPSSNNCFAMRVQYYCKCRFSWSKLHTPWNL